MACLIFPRDARQSIRFPLKRGKVLIGRRPDCEITLEGPQVSRDHASIHYDGGYYLIEDHSKNGTFLNEKKIRKERLNNGDLIAIGDWRIRFTDDAGESHQATVTVAMGQGEKSGEPTGEIFSGMVGISGKMREVFRLIEKVAPSQATVLILGETGAGKELVAGALHQLSKRSALPFVALNCAAISPNLIESELFGHEKGAFTGALQTHAGAFEQAAGGTLFLDEIGDLSLDLQSKLLRSLESLKIRRVGGQAELPVKCRIVTATHRNLMQEVKAGKFREDLYYRLFVIPIELPPLRQRREDIPSLARHFINQMRQMRPESPPAVTKEALGKLQEHLWPGNVRELKNVILRAILLADDGPVEAHHIVFLPQAVSEAAPEPQTLVEMEKEMILQKLKATGWNKAAAARELGLATSTIFKKIKDYGLKEP